MATDNTAVDLAINELKLFANTDVSDSVFQSAIESATQKALLYENNLTRVKILEIQQIANRAGDPVLRDEIQQSYSVLNCRFPVIIRC